MVSLLDGCSDQCGIIAAVIAALSYGTYGVPIKATKHYPIHPLMFQTYKTATMFIFCWNVLWLGVDVRFSYWGLVSGLLWVLGGTCGVISIRYAGMAIAVGTWASVMILVNFIWGIVIFQEPVADIPGTAMSFALLLIGLVGMSKYSEPAKKYKASSKLCLLQDEDDQPTTNPAMHRSVSHSVVDQMKQLCTAPWGSFQNIRDDIRRDSTEDLLRFMEGQQQRQQQQHQDPRDPPQKLLHQHQTYGTIITPETDCSIHGNDYAEHVIVDDNMTSSTSSTSSSPSTSPIQHCSSTMSENTNDNAVVVLFGYELSHRTVGIMGAVCNGVFTGTSFIPVHYAKVLGFGGPYFMISYATGALISNIVLWILYFIYQFIVCHDHNDNVITMNLFQRLYQTYQHLPKTYFRQMWFPGCMAGLLLTTAMFGTLLSVTYLGQGVGNSLIQAKILVSGMWGIFWYKEINEPEKVRKWFLSSCFTIVGIVWLTYERLEADRLNNLSHLTAIAPTVHHHVIHHQAN